ncbi:uncharacterized protein LOC118765995 isoform X2 [Octopus sinensis]|uniref:Uncharacterized protein LOC118765995 isoform X2 n=1 Tax=Octopus sinensis TaxID=2607531 RepID=A0A7E6FDA3_9MOLL|nr:uncharacterized protein LOC118765995 isoform X2 [Octopus sinensis]
MFWFMVLVGANSLNMVICLSKTNSIEFNYNHGRIYLISYQKKSWTDASSYCQNRAGHLATIYEPSTIPEMGFTKQNRTFWVGLQWNKTKSLSSWSNWHSPPSKPSAICGSVLLQTPYTWYAMECTFKLPFICEIRNGSCRYAEIKNSILRGTYSAHRMQVSVEQCKHICEEGVLGFTCRSFVWHIKHSYCQFSEGKLWMTVNYTLEHHENWNYYQKNCTTKVIIIEVTDEFVSSSNFLSESYHPVIESSLFPLTLWPSTSEPVQLSTSFTLLSLETSQLLYCTEICFDNMSKTLVYSSSSVLWPTSSSSSSIDELLADIQNMNQRLKDKAKTLKKISIEDNRISSISIGTLGIIIMISIFALVVALDIFTLKCRCSKLKNKRKCSLLPFEENPQHNDANNFTNIGKPSSFHSNKTTDHEKDDNTEGEELEISTKF